MTVHNGTLQLPYIGNPNDYFPSKANVENNQINNNQEIQEPKQGNLPKSNFNWIN